jgi:hypothetical protein
MKKLLQEIDEGLERSEALLSGGEVFSGVLGRAEIANISLELPESVRRSVESRCDVRRLSEEAIRSAVSGIRETSARIRRILSVGSRWNDDEWLLIFTLRINICVLTRYLHQRLSKNDTDVLDVRELDGTIRGAAGLRGNRKPFESALRCLQKNALPTGCSRELIERWKGSHAHGKGS